MEGKKFDSGKVDWTLMPFDSLEDVVYVLMFGAQKYARDNWQKVPNPKQRYIAAAMRHIVAYQKGEKKDSESGLPHLAHAACCILFTAWFDKKEEQDEKIS